MCNVNYGITPITFKVWIAGEINDCNVIKGTWYLKYEWLRLKDIKCLKDEWLGLVPMLLVCKFLSFVVKQLKVWVKHNHKTTLE